MIDLTERLEPYEVPLPYGLAVTVRPLTTAGMATAQAAACRRVEAIERQARERTETGLPPDGLPDLSAEGTPAMFSGVGGAGPPSSSTPVQLAMCRTASSRISCAW